MFDKFKNNIITYKHTPYDLNFFMFLSIFYNFLLILQNIFVYQIEYYKYYQKIK